MERKISFKNLYLVGVISLGLIGLGVGSTFAMFTASAEINDSISLTSGLEYTDDIVDLVDMTISSNKVETATLNITNNTDKVLNYTSWYKTNNNNLQIGTVVSNGYSVTGTIEPNASAQIIVSIRNRGTGVAKVTVGISASESDIVVSDGITTLPTDPLPPYLNDYITSLYASNKDDGTVTNNSIEYKYASSVNLMNDRLGGTTEDLDGGNIRYYGASPANYIDIGDRTSNDEVILWRIIGVFDGKVRIRRNDNIGDYSYDTSSPDINGGYGVNEWSQADLMKLLNPGYDNNQDFDNDGTTKILVNNSLWWNSDSGKCYNGQSYANVNCDFTSSGLSDNAKKIIVNQTLYLGGYITRSVYPNEAYARERQTNNYSADNNNCQESNLICNDTVTRTSTWTGKVGLLAPSDFAYASDFSNDSCKGNLKGLSNCLENWTKDVDGWTISPWSVNANGGLEHFSGGGFGGYADSVYDFRGGFPTLLLSKNTVLESGAGTSTDPYVVD